jgi:PAS domain S-box-containing protein
VSGVASSRCVRVVWADTEQAAAVARQRSKHRRSMCPRRLTAYEPQRCHDHAKLPDAFEISSWLLHKTSPWRTAQYARLAGTVGIVGGVVILAGWALDIPIVLAGFSLRGLAVNPHSRAAAILGACVALLGLLTLGEDVFDWNSGIDEWLIADPHAIATSSPGRMSPITAFCFVALGLALIASTNRRRPWLAQPPALLASLLAAVAMTGYLYDVRVLYGIGLYTTMAVHTAMLMFVLSSGLLFAQAEIGAMAPIMSDEVEGQVARRLILAGIVIPIVLGWFYLQGQRAGLYDTGFGLALMVVTSIVTLTFASWVNALSLGKADARRREAQDSLRRMNETLERRVDEQTFELSRSEAQLRLVIDKAHDAFIAIDQNGRIAEWNPQAEVTFGWPRADALGRPVRDLIIPERHRDAHTRGLARFLATGHGRVVGHRVEIEALHRDGRELPVELAVSSVLIDQTWRFNAFVRDLTATKRAERKFRDLLESAPDAIIIVDGHGRIALVNAQAETLFGYGRDEMVGHPVEMLVPLRFRDAHGPHRTGYFRDPRARAMGAGLDLYGLRRDGTEFPVEISLSPIETEDGTLVSTAVRDVTAAKAARDKLRSSLAEKEVLLKEIHHRVKNNMQVISSLLNLQADSARDPRLRASLIESQSRVRAMALLHQTLYQSDNMARVAFPDFANVLWIYLSRAFGKTNRGIRFQAGGDAPPLDVEQAVPCALILTELLSNAIKYAFPDDGRGSISVELDSLPEAHGLLRMRVCDDGAGLTAAQRAEATNRGSIGLKIIDALGRQLGATQTWSGPGTIFTMTFGIAGRADVETFSL